MAQTILAPLNRSLWARARDVLPLAIVFAVLLGLSFLPPDTSLSEVDRSGLLSVCMPTSYPPLVTGKPERPGFDVELVQEITSQLGWRLRIVSSSAMGRNFNPRASRINRAQCQMFAGGIALNPTTKSLLDTSRPYLATGWAFAAEPGRTFEEIDGPVGIFVGLAGLDRIALGQMLRERNLPVRIVESADALRVGLEQGNYGAAITEAFQAEQTFAETAYLVDLMPSPLEHLPLGFGFWKGDLTLKRKIMSAMEALDAEGFIQRLAHKYGIEAALQPL